MEMIAKIELISISHLDVFKWLRKELNLGLLESNELSKNGKVIDFNGDIEQAIIFYNYLHSCGTNSARLIIDHTYDTRGCIGAYYIEEK